ncbi:MAG: diguanylate cyclase [Chloroflexi bacterium]|nr:diguanylate cyclase [Chloroflexota bacterium]
MRLPRILAEALDPNNDALRDVVGDRARRAYPVWRLRRSLSLVAVVIGLMALLKLGPVPPLGGVLLLTAVLLSEAEIRIAARARSLTSFGIVVTAFRMATAMLVATGALAFDWPLLVTAGPLLLVVLSSAATLEGRALVTTTVATTGLALVTLVLLPSAGIVASAAAGIEQTGMALFFALVVVPGTTWWMRRGIAIAHRARESDATMDGRVRQVEGALNGALSEVQRLTAAIEDEVATQTRELSERNRYLSITSSVSLALTDSIDDEGALERAIRLIARLLDARAAQTFRLGEPAAGAFITVPADDMDVPRLPESLLREVAGSGQFLSSVDSDREVPLPDIGAPWMIAPLVAKGASVGALALIGSASTLLGEQERNLLLLLGREIGVVLAHCRRYENALDRAEREQLLAEAMRLMNGRGARDEAMREALRLISRHLGAETAALIALPDGPRKPQLVSVTSTRLGGTDETIDRMLRGTPQLISDRWSPMVLGEGGEAPLSSELAQRGIGTLVMAPVIAERNLQGLLPLRSGDPDAGRRQPPTRAMVGVLVLAMSTESEWNAERTAVVERVAAILSRRMETDELLQLQQRRITELSGLAEIARMMQTGADTERLYSGFAQALFSLLTYQNLHIVRLDDADALLEIPSFSAGGRSQPQPVFTEADRRHDWFALRAAAPWVALEQSLPSFADSEDRVGLVVPMRPKGQLLGLVVLGLSAPAQVDQMRIVEQAVEQLALALDNASLYRQATERASHIQALSNLARIVASVVDLREAFDAFAEEVRWLIPFERAVMLLMDPQSEMVEPYATYPDEIGGRRQLWPLTGSLAELAVDAGGPVSISRSDPRYGGYDWDMFGAGAQHIAAVPVRHGMRTVAVFALVQGGDAAYSVSDLDALGEVAGLLGVTIERLRLYEQAEHSARHDALTGLPNYRFLQERLARVRTGISEPGESAVIQIDMDSLKLFNDTLGHEAGDRVIQIVARTLRDAVREHDFVARTGGDEFVVVMEGVNAGDARTTAARMHEALKDAHQEFANAPCPIGISVGVAMAPTDADNTADLMQVADHAMYTAKFSGGDRTEFAAGVARGNMPPSHRRQTRLLELTMQACADGASGEERVARARAEGYLVAVGARLDFSELRLMSLRLLVAAEVGQRVAGRAATSLNTRIADASVRGARAEIRDAHPEIAEALLALPTALVDVAWMQRADAVDGPATFADQMGALHSRFGDAIDADTLRVIESVILEQWQAQAERRAA